MTEPQDDGRTSASGTSPEGCYEPTVGKRDRKNASIPKRALAAIGCLLIILLGATLLVILFSNPKRVPAAREFSPDSRIVAYITESVVDLPTPPELYTIRWKYMAHWFPAESPEKRRSIFLDSFGRKEHRNTCECKLLFSTDAKRLAVIGPRKLTIVDLASGKSVVLTKADEMPTGAAWSSLDEITYVTHGNHNGRYGTVFDRRVFAENVTERKRRQLFEQFDCETWRGESLSPNGRWLVSMQNSSDPIKLVDLSTGCATHEIVSKSIGFHASWKRDCSAVFILGHPAAGNPTKACLVKTGDGTVHDLSALFNEHFQEQLLCIDHLWTPSGDYVVINGGQGGGCLLRPEPFECIRLAKILCRDQDPSFGWIYQEPAAGWARFWNPDTDFASTYDGTQTVILGQSDSPGGGWILSPDGKYGMNFDRSGNPILKRVDIVVHPPGNTDGAAE
ncbi:MAG TPA: hypothetical protein PL033_09100 [Candidatus Brocadiia bacterium]|nr:hypothetical protein [Candidatus Brocadiia bacterium]